jgi:hypothetical protein
MGLASRRNDMTTLKALKQNLNTFKLKVVTPILADKTGGPTWKLVQQTAQRVPMATLPQIAYIENMMKSKDPKDRLKVQSYFKTMKDQWSVIKIDVVKKYSAEHGVGGAKNRSAGLKGLVTSSKTQQAEARRVALCDLFVQQYNKLNLTMKGLRKANDLDDLEGV